MSNYPDKKTTMERLAAWVKRYESVQNLMDAMEENIGLDIDGPLFETIWGLFSDYTDSLERELGGFGWMRWFYEQTDMGSRVMEGGYDDDVKPVQTLERLYKLIAEARKRAPK